MSKPLIVFLVALLLWVMLFAWAIPILYVGLATFAVFTAAIGWSAIYYRRRGWLSGVLFVSIIWTLPIWLFAMISYFERR